MQWWSPECVWSLDQQHSITLELRNANLGALSQTWASLVAQMVKHLPTMRETRARSLGREDPLEKEMATHSSTLAWKIPWMEEPGRLQSVGLQRVRHYWVTSLHFFIPDFPNQNLQGWEVGICLLSWALQLTLMCIQVEGTLTGGEGAWKECGSGHTVLSWCSLAPAAR